MKNFLTTTLLAAAAAAAPATAPNNDHTCTKRSTQVTEWTIKDFDFHASYIFTTPAHQNSWGYVNFTLANPAVDYPLQCMSSSNWLQDFYYGMINYNCTLPDGTYSDAGTFNFSRPTNELNINQTWSCPDEGSVFWAEGGIKLDLECTDETTKTPDWEPGQIYSSRIIACDKVTTPVKMESLRAIA
ncbi:hypothetical protein K4F52_002607 [Lecanicillium sp. MT-2017a]|nr:hypothetical protein K4F52_002607 [Lecanicillium sp. MT-2017a]